MCRENLVRLPRWLAVSLVLLATLGCGSKPRATVTGQVTYKGTPVSGGAITFHGEAGPRSAYIDPGGMYMVVAEPGPVKVTVVSAQPAAAPGGAPTGAGGGKGASKHPSNKPSVGAPVAAGITIPPKYKDPNQSGLSYTLTAGDQKIDIKVE